MCFIENRHYHAIDSTVINLPGTESLIAVDHEKEKRYKPTSPEDSGAKENSKRDRIL
jgi:hypothetical protein